MAGGMKNLGKTDYFKSGVRKKKGMPMTKDDAQKVRKGFTGEKARKQIQELKKKRSGR